MAKPVSLPERGAWSSIDPPMNDEPGDQSDRDREPLTVEVPSLLLDVLRHAAHRRGWTVDQLAREVLAEWAIREIRN